MSAPSHDSYSPATAAAHRMFTFRIKTLQPRATVRCHGCDWTAKGSDPRKVFPLADSHACPQEAE